MLLDRGAMITIPHDIKCGCEDCVDAQKDDSLRFSLARINSYKALSSTSMIALSSRDPIVTGRKIIPPQSLQRAKTLFQFCNSLLQLSICQMNSNGLAFWKPNFAMSTSNSDPRFKNLWQNWSTTPVPGIVTTTTSICIFIAKKSPSLPTTLELLGKGTIRSPSPWPRATHFLAWLEKIELTRIPGAL